MSRWRNVGLWISILALIPLALQVTGIVVPPDQYAAATKLINGILDLLVAAGILSNPTTQNLWFHDDKEN
jgi:uncharacterized membrane protein